MKLVINIPDNKIPKRQEIMSIDLHFIDGKVCECTYPFKVLEEDQLGEWICTFHSTFPQYEPDEYRCSKCNGKGGKSDKFCKHCGAKMKEEEK